MKEDKYLNIVESRRRNVIKVLENEYEGCSQNILPAIMTEMTTQETHKEYGMRKVIGLDTSYELFLTGLEIGEKRGRQ